MLLEGPYSLWTFSSCQLGYLYILVCFLCSFVYKYVCILYVFMLYNGSPIMEDNKESINQFICLFF